MSSNGPTPARTSRERSTFLNTIVDTPLQNSRQLLRSAAPTLRQVLPVPDDEVPARVRVLVALIIAALPWVILSIWAPGGAGDMALVVFTILVGATYSAYALASVWAHRQSPKSRRQPGVVLTQLLSATSYIEGWFALLYYILSADPTAGAFYPRLSRIDAAYFTISIATTTGAPDIHPITGLTRLLICVQLIVSLFLVVSAVGIAFQRFLPRTSVNARATPAALPAPVRADRHVRAPAPSVRNGRASC